MRQIFKLTVQVDVKPNLVAPALALTTLVDYKSEPLLVFLSLSFRCGGSCVAGSFSHTFGLCGSLSTSLRFDCAHKRKGTLIF